MEDVFLTEDNFSTNLSILSSQILQKLEEQHDKICDNLLRNTFESFDFEKIKKVENVTNILLLSTAFRLERRFL